MVQFNIKQRSNYSMLWLGCFPGSRPSYILTDYELEKCKPFEFADTFVLRLS